MKKFAFKLSISDWIRKLSYNYQHPVDFLDNFISLFYYPGAKVDINISDDKIGLRGSGTIEDRIFEEIERGNIIRSAAIIPPVKDYQSLHLQSGNYSLDIDERRNIQVKRLSAPQNGTELTIERANPQENEKERLADLFRGSDLDVKIDQLDVGLKGNFFDFQKDGLRGAVHYDPYEKGQIQFFQKGRYISSMPFISGIGVNLYGHDIPVTLTKSRVIIDGKGKKQYKKLQEALPSIMAEFLKSEYMAEIRKSSETSYQTLLRVIFNRFGDYKEILDIMQENVRFADHSGKINSDYSFKSLQESPRPISASELSLYQLVSGEKIPPKSILTKSRPKRLIVYGSLAAFIAGAGIAVTSRLMESYREDPEMGMELASSEDKSANQLELRHLLTIFTGSVQSGGDYLSRDDLARILTMPTDKSGYVRYDTSNKVFRLKKNIMWDDTTPLDKLISLFDVELPKELEGLENAPTKRKIVEVRKHIFRNFKYDAIEPEVGARYPDDLTALLSEKRAICSYANSYAAILLSKMGEENIRYAIGTHNGIPHAWLEANYDGRWKVADFSPPRIDKELMGKINIFGGMGRDSSIAHNVKIEDLITYMWDSKSIPISLSGEFDLMRQNPIGYVAASSGLTGFLMMSLSAVTMLGAGAYAGALSLKRRLSTNTNNSTTIQSAPEDVCQMQLKDILGIPVKIADNTQMFYSEGTLYLPKDILKQSPLQTATEIIPQLAISEKQKLGAYRRIANLAK